jgi:hypothetical protein
MRRTMYVCILCLFMGYFACFSDSIQNALAAPQVSKMYNALSSPEKQAYSQHDNKEHRRLMEKYLDKPSQSSAQQGGKGFRSELLWKVSASEASSQQAFNFPWPILKAFDISSLWKQQRDKQKRKDVYDDGE